MNQQLKPGDGVIYRMSKRSRCPDPRARQIQPAPHGDDYGYCVDKYWVVVAVRAANSVVVRTGAGKLRFLDADDPSLRRATWWERLWYGDRFPSFPRAPAAGPQKGEAEPCS